MAGTVIGAGDRRLAAWIVGGGARRYPGSVPAVVEVRRARVEDAAELVRLRIVMLTSVNGYAPTPGPWIEAAEHTLRERLADPAGSLMAFVVDKDDQLSGDQPAGLATCVVGVIEHRLPSPDNPSGGFGYVFNVATDAAYRRRGYARACMASLLDWYRQRGVSRVGLSASSDDEPLYRSLGFARQQTPAMRLMLPAHP